MIISVRGKVPKILDYGEVPKVLRQLVQEVAPVMFREFKLGAPVRKTNLLRNSTRVTYDTDGLGANVFTDAVSGGQPYPKYVAFGTGRFKGLPDALPHIGGTNSSVRALGYPSAKGGIRPNRWHERALKRSEPSILKSRDKLFKQAIARQKQI